MAIKIKLDENERQRLYNMFQIERQLLDQGYRCIAGVDEAGRGPLAGPVVAAAVILDPDILIPGINDSKKLSPQKREYLYEEIIKKAVSYSVGIVDQETIDKINILNATITAMETAIKTLSINPDILLIDAVNLKNISIPKRAIVKGDTLSLSIAAASIIAKVERDRIVSQYDIQYPDYEFSKHKGYGTKKHIECIKKYGLLPVHRKTFTKNI